MGKYFDVLVQQTKEKIFGNKKIETPKKNYKFYRAPSYVPRKRIRILPRNFNVMSIFIPAIILIITLNVFSSVQSTMMNVGVFSSSVENLLNIIPLILVGVAIITIVMTGLRFVD
jgi:hypothetical protein